MQHTWFCLRRCQWNWRRSICGLQTKCQQIQNDAVFILLARSQEKHFLQRFWEGSIWGAKEALVPTSRVSRPPEGLPGPPRAGAFHRAPAARRPSNQTANSFGFRIRSPLPIEELAIWLRSGLALMETTFMTLCKTF